MGSLAALTVLETVRTPGGWALLALAPAAWALAAFVHALALGEHAAQRAVLAGGFLRLAAVLLVTLQVTLGAQREQEGGMAALLMALPSSRGGYLAGRLLGHAVLALAAAAVAGLALGAAGAPGGVLIWAASLLLELLLVAAVALLCQWSLRHCVPATLAALAFYACARCLDTLRLLAAGAAEPGGAAGRLLRGAVEGLGLLLPALDRYAPSHWLVEAPAPAAALTPLVGQTLTYGLLVLAAARIDLHRREL